MEGIFCSWLAAQPPPERVTVTGRIVEAGTDRPAVRVAVLLSPKSREGEAAGESAQAITDEQGQFSLKEVAEGLYLLSLSSPSHHFYSQELKVTPGMEPLLLSVQRLPRIRGRLRRAEGAPLANMQVDIQCARLGSGGWPEAGSVTTDGEGRYEVPVRQPGRNLLTLWVPTLGYARSEVEVLDRDVEGVDLQLAPGVSWGGRLRIRGTEEVPRQVSLSLEERDGSTVLSHYVPPLDEEGRFRLQNLPPGSYQVSAYGRDYLRSSPQPLTLAPGQTVTDFLVEVSPAPVLSGRLRAPDGSSLAGRELEFEAYTLKESLSYHGWGIQRLILDAHSRFTVRAPETGPAYIFIRLAEVGYLTRRLEVQEGSDFSGLEWELQPFFTVAGQVRDKRTQQPLPGIPVSLWRQSPDPLPMSLPQALSGADGRFELRNLIAGEYLVNCNTPGYNYLEGRRVRLVPGSLPEELLIELERGTPVAGRVVGPDGRTPLAGARVSVLVEGEPPSLEQTTDADGRFAFESVARGNALQVQAEGFAVATQPLWLEGADSPVEVTLALRYRGGTVTGRVYRADTGQPIAEAVVLAFDPSVSQGGDPAEHFQALSFDLRPEEPGLDFNQWPWPLWAGMPRARTDAEGRYELTHVGEGEYLLYALAPGQGWAQRENVAVREGQTVTGVDLPIAVRQDRPPAGGRISGTLTDPEGKPLANVRVVLQGIAPGHIFTFPGQTDANGRYLLDPTSGIPPGPGPYTLLVKVEGFRAGKRDRIDLGEDGVAENVDFQLQVSSFGSLSGQVFLPDGQTPAAGVRVFPVLPGSIWPDPTVHQSAIFLQGEPFVVNGSQAAVTDAAGRFRIERLEAGDYRVLAVPCLSGLAYGLPNLFAEALPQDPRLEQASSALSEAVAVPENGVGEVRLTLALAGRIEGRVRSAEDGRPLPDVSVSAQPRHGQFSFGGGSDVVHTDAAGRFQIPGLSPGTYILGASAAGRMHPGREIEVVAGGTATVELKMWAWKPVTVAGRVLLPDGQTPAPRAYVTLEGQALRPARTDSEGRFELVGEALGRTRVVAWKVGYGSAVSGWFNLPPGGARRDLTVTLAEAGTVSGRIAWADGSDGGPGELVVVAVPAGRSLAKVDPGRRWDWSTVGAFRQARADQEGRFTLTDVTAGPNTLVVFVNGLPRWVRKEVGVQRRCAPTVGGTLEGLVWTLPPARGRLIGRVLDADSGRPLPGGSLTLIHEVLGIYRLSVQTDDQGCYTFAGIPPGAYRVLVSAPAHANRVSGEITLPPSLALPPPAGEEGVMDFRLSVGGRVTGTVLGPQGEPLAGAWVSTVPWGTGGLTPEFLPAGLSLQTTSVQEDGSYTLAPLAPGEYTLYAGAPGYVEAQREGVRVWEGETTAGVNWSLGKD